jgi:hypothetical protein
VKLALAALLALAPAAASAKALPRYGTFVYSDLCWEKETGDAGGVRFILTRTRKGARLDYEYGAGPLQGAHIKSLKIDGDRIEADASTPDGDLHITATLGPRKAELSERLDYAKSTTRASSTVKRIKSFKAKIPACR